MDDANSKTTSKANGPVADSTSPVLEYSQASMPAPQDTSSTGVPPTQPQGVSTEQQKTVNQQQNTSPLEEKSVTATARDVSGTQVQQSQGPTAGDMKGVGASTSTPAVDMPAASQPPVAPTTPGEVITTDISSKKPFSKIILVVLGLVVLLGASALAFWKYGTKGFLGFGKTGEIVWWGLWEEENVVMPLIKEYQEKNKNVKITYIKQSPQDYRERLVNSLAKGEGPDIFRFHNSWVPMLKNELDSMPSSVMNAEEFGEVYYPIITSDLIQGSSIVGMPLGYDALTLFINEDIFISSGKTPPKTWDDFRQLAKDLTIKDEKGNILQAGVAMGITENIDHWQEIVALMMIQNGVDLSKPDKQPSLASDALAFYKVFYNTDKVWSSILPPSTVAFANGKSAMYFGPTWRTFEIQHLNPNLRFRTVTLPQLPKESPSDPDVSYATYWVEGVWARSANKNIAWDFLKFLSSRESLEKLYKNASNTRAFGEPYPRVDMADLLKDHPIVGNVIASAPYAKSWYLVSRTFDGATGINSQINQYYEDLVNASSQKGASERSLTTTTNGVSQVLSQYNLVK